MTSNAAVTDYLTFKDIEVLEPPYARHKFVRPEDLVFYYHDDIEIVTVAGVNECVVSRPCNFNGNSYLAISFEQSFNDGCSETLSKELARSVILNITDKLQEIAEITGGIIVWEDKPYYEFGVESDTNENATEGEYVALVLVSYEFVRSVAKDYQQWKSYCQATF